MKKKGNKKRDVEILFNNCVYTCYKLIQRFRVTGLFAGQYNTKLHGTIIEVIIYLSSQLLSSFGSKEINLYFIIFSFLSAFCRNL